MNPTEGFQKFDGHCNVQEQIVELVYRVLLFVTQMSIQMLYSTVKSRIHCQRKFPLQLVHTTRKVPLFHSIYSNNLYIQYLLVRGRIKIKILLLILSLTDTPSIGIWRGERVVFPHEV